MSAIVATNKNTLKEALRAAWSDKTKGAEQRRKAIKYVTKYQRIYMPLVTQARGI